MSQSNPLLAKTVKNVDIWLIALIVIETLFVTTAMVPLQLWTRILPASSNTTLNGPYPAHIAPVISALIYFIPSIIGFLCRHWQRALLFATLPAWLALGAFVVAATFKVGAFYLISTSDVTANVSILELFAVLGAIGWLARHLFKMS